MKVIGKKFGVVVLSVTILLAAQIASAHSVVTPNQAGVASFTNFSLGVPSEKPQATVSVRLLIPSGLKFVTPFVKPGWTIAVKKDGDNVTEIDWTGGSIPAEQKDQFMFSAQVPSQPTTLAWKVYQTYKDGSVVSWDQDPAKTGDSDDDSAAVGPYSTTQIVNDLGTGASSTDLEKQQKHSTTTARVSLAVSVLAALLAAWALSRRSNH